jgi:hypothetical protein
MDDSAHYIDWNTTTYSDYRKFKTIHDFGIQHMPLPLHHYWDKDTYFAYHWSRPDGPFTKEDMIKEQRLTLQAIMEELHNTAVVYLPDEDHANWDRRTNWTFQNNTRKHPYLPGIAQEVHQILKDQQSERNKRSSNGTNRIEDWMIDSIFGRNSDTGMLARTPSTEPKQITTDTL